PWLSSISQRAARRPSSTKSEPISDTYSESSDTLTARSVSTTGMPAALASRSTVSQPDSTTGEKAITSTFCAMKERSALIWFSCFCWASEKRSRNSGATSASLTDRVLAVRHSLSAPTWLKPTVIASPPAAPPPSPPEQPASAIAPSASTANRYFFIAPSRLLGVPPPRHRWQAAHALQHAAAAAGRWAVYVQATLPLMCVSINCHRTRIPWAGGRAPSEGYVWIPASGRRPRPLP